MIHTDETIFCWESGGPDWLFVAGLISAAFAVLGASWWFSARRAPGPPVVSPSLAGSVLALVVVGGVMVVFGGELVAPWTVVPLAVWLLSSYVVSEALRLRALASDDGVEFVGGWAMTYRVVRVGSPVLVALGIAAAVGFAVASMVMGSECVG